MAILYLFHGLALKELPDCILTSTLVGLVQLRQLGRSEH